MFELVAKLRAARAMWAKKLKESFGARDPRSLQLPIHVQTSGAELTRQQPLNNIVRVALQSLGAVLGDAQSLHTDSWDEAMTTPSRDAALIALMTRIF
ncbi:MAG: methylmalonyl-CoA mutase family protein [Candidatus Bathyarchaeia archaeon]